MLEIRSIHVNYGPRPVLKDVSLQVRKGEMVALIGPNGSGKTTLIRSTSGVLDLISGSILLGGKDLKRMSFSQRATSLAVVPQARNLPETFTVFDTVLLGRTPYLGWLGQPGPKDRERVAWALERADIRDLGERMIGELSGGEQQLVLLARALAQETPILLLDEPTAHLDLRHQARLLNLVRELAHAQGLAVLMAVHDLNLAALYADRVALLVEGRLRAVGTPEEVLTNRNLGEAYQVPLSITRHPEYGTPLILPDGFEGGKFPNR